MVIYPLWRGEHRFSASAWQLAHGLSPLARGTQSVWFSPGKRHRFIPARAGNTIVERDLSGIEAVYPRSRGEHLDFSLYGCHHSGLSPLARGTLSDAIEAELIERFIPARAGNTQYCRTCRLAIWVYPRSRGEHINAGICFFPATGLSPLARGTRHPSHSGYPSFRFIPARAGNTLNIIH